jgi:hypothetical protein
VTVECPSRHELVFRRPGVAVAVNLGDGEWSAPDPMPGWRVAMASEDVSVFVPEGVG